MYSKISDPTGWLQDGRKSPALRSSLGGQIQDSGRIIGGDRHRRDGDAYPGGKSASSRYHDRRRRALAAPICAVCARLFLPPT